MTGYITRDSCFAPCKLGRSVGQNSPNSSLVATAPNHVRRNVEAM